MPLAPGPRRYSSMYRRRCAAMSKVEQRQCRLDLRVLRLRRRGTADDSIADEVQLEPASLRVDGLYDAEQLALLRVHDAGAQAIVRPLVHLVPCPRLWQTWSTVGVPVSSMNIARQAQRCSYASIMASSASRQNGGNRSAGISASRSAIFARRGPGRLIRGARPTSSSIADRPGLRTFSLKPSCSSARATGITTSAPAFWRPWRWTSSRVSCAAA